MKKILITGASGYVGANLSYLLAKSGNKITALCYPEIPNDKRWIGLMEKVLVGDITQKEVINKVTDNNYDVVIHLVSFNHHDSNKEPELVNSVNVLPAWNLLNFFSKKHTLKKFIYFSTIHVYGEIPLKEISEKFKPNPQTTYGLTHLLVENICNMYNHISDIECVNIRMSNSYGEPFFKENNCWWLVVNDFCKAAFYDKRIVLQSNGAALRDFIHYQDIYNAIQVLINYSGEKADNAFHLSSGETLSIYHLAEKVKSVFNERYGKEIPILLPEGKEPPIHSPKKYIIKNEKIKKIGFCQKVDMETGINNLFAYLERNEH